MPLRLPFAVAFVALLLVLAPPARAQYETNYQRRTDGRSLSVHLIGPIETSVDGRQVLHLAPGRHLSIEEAFGGTTRRVEMTPGAEGGVRLTYTVNGRVRPLDAEGRAWVEEVVEEAVLEGGIGAEARAERLLQTEGLAGALAWADHYRSDEGRLAHLQALLNRTSDRPDDAARVLARGVRVLGADGERRRLLLHGLQAVGLDAAAVRDAYFGAAGVIGSDGDLRAVLVAALTDGRPRREIALGVLGAVAHIGSDGDRAAVLLAVPAEGLAHADVARAYFDAVEQIGSDGDQARVLVAALYESPRRPEVALGALGALVSVGSDGDRVRVMLAVPDALLAHRDVAHAYRAAARAIHSDGDRTRALDRSPLLR